MESVSEVKVVFLGNSEVGKSSIVRRYAAESFSSEYLATIGAAFMSKTVVLNTHSVKLNFWDVAGGERFRSLAPMYYRDAAEVILVYDITNKSSFDILEYWYSELKKSCHENLRISVVGNKEDLAENELVSDDEARDFANRIGAIFFKCSAKDNLGIEKIFSAIVERIVVAS